MISPILTDVGGASALPIARGVIVVIAVVLFVFVVILVIALATGAVMLVRKQKHSRRKKKSVLPSHAGVFTAMKSVCEVFFNLPFIHPYLWLIGHI
jgi:flagellar basal body-associated protein FliL